MATMMWCIYCEEFVEVFSDQNEGSHAPFYTSAPPEDLSDNWQDELVDPSVEELQEMDKMSELLLWDLGLAEK